MEAGKSIKNAAANKTILKKGRHSYNLPSLFPKTHAAESLISAYKKHKALNIANIDQKTYNELIGIYEMPSELVQKTALAIMRSGDKLFGFYPESPYDELLPISDNQFLNISKNGVVKVTFNKEKNGEVTKLTVETEKDNFTAKKIK